jgi:hypothetical protein
MEKLDLSGMLSWLVAVAGGLALLNAVSSRIRQLA